MMLGWGDPFFELFCLKKLKKKKQKSLISGRRRSFLAIIIEKS